MVSPRVLVGALCGAHEEEEADKLLRHRDVSSSDLGKIVFTDTHEPLQTLCVEGGRARGANELMCCCGLDHRTCENASLTQLDVNMTYLQTLQASNNRFSSFEDVVLSTTIEWLYVRVYELKSRACGLMMNGYCRDLSWNQLADWENFKPPRDLQTLYGLYECGGGAVVVLI
ncbi:unnamed protein product [Phytophthora lilii]|uniref:Unnamed protein product n=1 Tax=Phytophthora lilii TaxID=2077276 RepID=A0A9W6TUU6_9STRA|nr:unnamed protein product [Phytophthora lilii]